MYVPSHFDEQRIEVLYDLIENHPFGILVSLGENGLDANHIPFEINSKKGNKGTLSAHVARSNSLWEDVSDGDEVLVVFRAAEAYVSPNWYASKHEFHKQVPTWNYIVVHAHGRITVRSDERFVRSIVARLTRTHEAAQPVPWKMTDSSPDFIDSLLKDIVGVEIEITRLVGKFKLSQNKGIGDLRSAGEALRERGELVIGDAMLDCVNAKQDQS